MIVGALPLNSLAQRFNQGINMAALNQHVVGGDTGLPAVHAFSKNNICCRFVEIRIACHDGGRLAAQFKRRWGQIRRGCLGHLPTYRAGAGEHQVIERQTAKTTRHLYIAFYYLEFFRGEVLRHQSLQ